jgi:putative MFS transporter
MVYVVLMMASMGWIVLSYWDLGWRWFLALCALPNVLLFVARVCWPYESPRYLLVNDSETAAVATLTVMARWNGKSLPEDIHLKLPHRPVETDQPWTNVLHGLPVFRTIMLMIIWFTITFGYYGIMVWLPVYMTLKDITAINVYQNLLVMGAAEIPGLAVTIVLMERWGRVKGLLFNLVGCAVACVAFGFAQSTATVIVSSAVLFFFIVGDWTIVYIWTPELYATAVRSRALSIIGIGATVAGMVSAPIGGLLFDSGWNDISILCMYAVAFGIGAGCTLCLGVETLDRGLPDVLENESLAHGEDKVLIEQDPRAC